jgi:hypothetical protein
MKLQTTAIILIESLTCNHLLSFFTGHTGQKDIKSTHSSIILKILKYETETLALLHVPSRKLSLFFFQEFIAFQHNF